MEWPRGRRLGMKRARRGGWLSRSSMKDSGYETRKCHRPRHPQRHGPRARRRTLANRIPIYARAFSEGFGAAPGPERRTESNSYDDLGGGVGQTIGFVEGREAASPFDKPTPIDAVNAALVDEIFYNPFRE